MAQPSQKPSGPARAGRGGPTAPAKKSRGFMRIVLLGLFVLAVLLVLVLWRVAGGPRRAAGETPAAIQVAGSLVHTSQMVLSATDDAGAGYIDSTVFVGDSNTVRLANYQLLRPQQVLAKENIGIEAVTGMDFVQLEGAGGALTIAEAIAVLQPKRVLIMLGTNDISEMSPNEYVRAYRKTLEEIRKGYDGPIIVCSIPPVRKNCLYGNITSDKVKTYNFMLRSMCGEMGLPYLDANEALANPGGWALPLYTVPDGVHFSEQGGQALLGYVRTHAYLPQDAG